MDAADLYRVVACKPRPIYGQALKGARRARSLDSPDFPRWTKLSDGERSATVAPAQEAGRILLDVILRKKHQTKDPLYQRTKITIERLDRGAVAVWRTLV